MGGKVNCQLLSNPSVTGGYTRNIGGNIPGKDSVVAWGPSRYAPEASAGIPLVIVNSMNFLRRRQEASAPAPSTEKSVPHGSKRTGWASRPWAPWAFSANLFSSDLGHPPVTEGLQLLIKKSNFICGRTQQLPVKGAEKINKY